MQKLFLCLLSMSITSAFAVGTASAPTSSATVAAASPACTKAQSQLQAYRQQTIAAFKAKDACTLGKSGLQSHNLIQANLACFPKYAKGEYNLFHVFDKVDTSMITFPAGCETPRATVTGNNQKIKQALIKEDGCTAGKIELDSYNIVQANRTCFPRAMASPENFMKAVDTIDANKTSTDE